MLNFSLPFQSPTLLSISPHPPQCWHLNTEKTGPTDPRVTTRCHPRVAHDAGRPQPGEGPVPGTARTPGSPEDTGPPHSSARVTGRDTFQIAESSPRACSQRSHVTVTSSSLRMSTHIVTEPQQRHIAWFLPSFLGEISTRRPVSSETPRRCGRRCHRAGR